jgi:hypothetical protein
MIRSVFYLALIFLALSCRKDEPFDPASVSFGYNTVKVDGLSSGTSYKGLSEMPVIKIAFDTKVDQTSAKSAITLTDKSSSAVQLNFSFENSDSVILVKPVSSLNNLTNYTFTVSNSLKAKAGGRLSSPISLSLTTGVDLTSKYETISKDSLLTLVQKQTFKYFWNLGHQVSGMALERNTSGDIVTSGGTGFGIMAIPVAINRKFISRADGLVRVQQIVNFLTNKAARFHGAFSHWINGTTGAVVPFGTKDNGADIVETSYLMMGLLTARQYFDGPSSAEVKLRNDINALWHAVEWDWFRKGGENMLYWNWSADYGFAVNVPVRGWNECLITYVLAASSTTHPIDKAVYDTGFARNGAMRNNNTYYGIQLPLGDALGGPLFFEHYSFLGINPFGLSDAYANYQTQVVNHSKINYAYCKDNPQKYYGYSENCWGLTASDIKDGYTASSPTNDQSFIAPTAAICSMPFTPDESMQALNFFYYKLGDKIWKQYGFVDAFSLDKIWFADSFLAIDQGPQIGMIENYRTGLLWKLFMSCPEVQAGLTKLGFTYNLP